MNKSTTNPSTQVQRLLENFDIEQTRLFAVAPDLLAALVEIESRLSPIEGLSPSADRALGYARAAIAKATGKA